MRIAQCTLHITKEHINAINAVRAVYGVQNIGLSCPALDLTAQCCTLALHSTQHTCTVLHTCTAQYTAHNAPKFA